jgi:membrane protease YdiL (CAAX protease family)
MSTMKSLQARPLRAKEALSYYFLLLALLFLSVPLSQVVISALELSDFASLFADDNSVLVERILLLILETFFVAFIIWYHKPFLKVSDGLPGLGLKRVSTKTILVAAAIGVGFGLMVLLLFFVELIPWNIYGDSEGEHRIRVNILTVVILTLIAVTFVPVFEELMFRGAIFSGIDESWGSTTAIVLSSVLFVSVHFRFFIFVSWLPLLCIFILSIIIGFFRAKTKSVVPGIVIHSAYNLVVAFADFQN